MTRRPVAFLRKNAAGRVMRDIYETIWGRIREWCAKQDSTIIISFMVVGSASITT